MAVTPTLTFAALKLQIQKRQLSPVYLLHGEEGFYIDELLKLFENILTPEEKDFNQYVLYAPEVEPATVMDTCRRYPMMADRLIVILKEAQTVGANYLNALAPYISNPSSDTVLVIASRGKKVEGKGISAALKKGGGVEFETKKLQDYNVGPVLQELIREQGLNIDGKALEMLREYVGTDLSHLYKEVEKLKVILPAGAMITPEVVERNIGISKDYNNFELVGAISRRDARKAMTITDYFRKNPKAHPPMTVLPSLFTFFSNLLIGFYSPDKSERGLQAALGLKNSFAAREVITGMRNYSAWQTIEIIGEIRRCEAMTKGVGSRMDMFDHLETLIYRILTAPGKVKLEG